MATTPVFSDEQIASILNLINTTRHTQYIGARYVPIFGRKGETPIEWDNSAPYEPLTIVLHQGNSYTSRQYVPTGIDILNEDFWANTGNYNAQIEQYRQDVLRYDTRITTAQTGADAANDKLAAFGINTVQDATTAKTEADERAATVDHMARNLPVATIDPDGNAAEQLQAQIDASAGRGGIVIPAGVYTLDAPLNTPYNWPNANDWTMVAYGAVFKPANAMDYVIGLGYNDASGAGKNNLNLYGLTVDGSYKAKKCIKISTNVLGGMMADVTAYGATEVNIHIGDGTHQYGSSQNYIISNVQVGKLDDYSDNYTPVNMLLSSADITLTNVTSFDTKTHIQTSGNYLTASNIHCYTKRRVPSPITGIACAGGNFSNIYVDWVDVGVETSSNGTLLDGKMPLNVSNIFYYRPDNKDTGDNLLCAVRASEQCVGSISGISAKIDNPIHQNSNYRPVVLYNADHTQTQTIPNDIYVGTGCSLRTWDNGFVNSASMVSNAGPHKLVEGDAYNPTETNGTVIGAIPSGILGLYKITLMAENGSMFDEVMLQTGVWLYMDISSKTRVNRTNLVLNVSQPVTITLDGVAKNYRYIYVTKSSTPKEGTNNSLKNMFVKVESAYPYYLPFNWQLPRFAAEETPLIKGELNP